MPVREPLSNRSGPILTQVKHETLLMRSLEFTNSGRSNLLLERLSQAMHGRFLCFAPISYVSFQNRSKFDPIYHELCRARTPSPEDATALFCPKRALHTGKKMIVLPPISAMPKENG